MGRDAASGWSFLALDDWVLNIGLRLLFSVALISVSLSVVNLESENFHCKCSLGTLINLATWSWGPEIVGGVFDDNSL